MTLRLEPTVTLRSLTLAVSLVLIGAAACSRPAQKAEPAPAPVEATPVETIPAVDTSAPAETAAPVAATSTEAAPVTTETAATAAAPAVAPTPPAATAAVPKAAAPAAADELVILETTVGPITIDVFEDKAPLHAANFKKNVLSGVYDGAAFHRVIAGFMAQGGGHYGPNGQPIDSDHTVPAEIDRDLLHHRGAVAGARLPDQVNPKRQSSGDQFYISYGPAQWLDGGYTIFGEVVAGMENAEKITQGPQERNGVVDPATATVITKARLAPKK